METSFVYITAPDRDQAGAIGRELVETRLAACVNIIEGMRSLYRWKGKVEEDEEVVLIAKTRASLVDELADKVRSLHSDECPCVVSFRISGGYRPFLDWIAEETDEGASRIS